MQQTKFNAQFFGKNFPKKMDHTPPRTGECTVECEDAHRESAPHADADAEEEAPGAADLGKDSDEQERCSSRDSRESSDSNYKDSRKASDSENDSDSEKMNPKMRTPEKKGVVEQLEVAPDMIIRKTSCKTSRTRNSLAHHQSRIHPAHHQSRLLLFLSRVNQFNLSHVFGREFFSVITVLALLSDLLFLQVYFDIRRQIGLKSRFKFGVDDNDSDSRISFLPPGADDDALLYNFLSSRNAIAMPGYYSPHRLNSVAAVNLLTNNNGNTNNGNTGGVQKSVREPFPRAPV
jgi:hypothetical protein